MRKMYLQTAVLVVLAAAVSAFFEWRRWPLSILTGGALGLGNHRALSWGVTGIMEGSRSILKMVFFSAFRLVLICLIIGLLLYLGLISLFGVLVGFTIVFTMVLREGVAQAKKLE